MISDDMSIVGPCGEDARTEFFVYILTCNEAARLAQRSKRDIPQSASLGYPEWESRRAAPRNGNSAAGRRQWVGTDPMHLGNQFLE